MVWYRTKSHKKKVFAFFEYFFGFFRKERKMTQTYVQRENENGNDEKDSMLQTAIRNGSAVCSNSQHLKLSFCGTMHGALEQPLVP